MDRSHVRQLLAIADELTCNLIPDLDLARTDRWHHAVGMAYDHMSTLSRTGHAEAAVLVLGVLTELADQARSQTARKGAST